MLANISNRKIVAFLCSALLSVSATAGIVNTEVEIGHKFDYRFDHLETVVVKEGSEDTVDVYLGQNSDGRVGYFVDVDSNKIDVTFYFPRNYTWFTASNTMNGVYLSGSKLDADMFKSSATITNNTMYFSQERIIVIDAHTIGLDMQRLNIWNGATFSLAFNQPAEVDEPVSLAMFALGGAALGLARRRSKRQLTFKPSM